ncbi:MAG: KilA-N domain-containing protein [Planctomycetota bacterium]
MRHHPPLSLSHTFKESMMSTEIVTLGEYRGTVIQCRDDEFVNATQMCKAAGKLWADYWRLEHTQEFARELSDNMGIPIKKLVTSKRGNRYQRGGTWVHRRIAIHLAQWCSPAFAVWVSDQIESIMLGKRVAHREHAEARAQQVGILTMEQAKELFFAGTALAIEPVVERIESVDKKVDAGFSSINQRIDKLERRRQLSAATKRQHVDTVRDFYMGRCPCCETVQILDESANRLENANFEHWEGPAKNQPHQTWIVCRDCNLELLNSHKFKLEMKVRFDSFQQRREQRHAPLLTGLVSGGGGRVSWGEKQT